MHTRTHRSASLDRGSRSQPRRRGPEFEESTSTQDRGVNLDPGSGSQPGPRIEESTSTAGKHKGMHKSMHACIKHAQQQSDAQKAACMHKHMHKKTFRCLLLIELLFLLLHHHYHPASMHEYKHAHMHASKCQPRPRSEESTWTQDRGVNLDPGSKSQPRWLGNTKACTKTCMHA